MSGTLLFQNNAAGTLGVALAAIAVSATLTAGHGGRFPVPAAGQSMLLTIQEGANFEIVRMTARTTDVITITRAQESTTARAFSVGASVEARITAGSMGAHVQGPAAIAQSRVLGRSTAGTGPAESLVVGTGLAAAGGVLSLDALAVLAQTSVGDIKARAAAAVPAGWLLCGGQAVSRTTYALLFAALGTTYGVGNGTTTFNVPDYRGRSLFGRDDMNGTAANRLTVAGSTVAGITLGAVGGSEFLHSHGHAIIDGGHTHTITDTGHTHGHNDPGHSHSVFDPGHTHAVFDPGHLHSLDVTVLRAGGGQGVSASPASFGTDFYNATAQGVGTGVSISGAATGISIVGSGTGMTNTASFTGVTAVTSSANVTVSNNGGGSAQNIPPAAVVNWVIFAGV